MAYLFKYLKNYKNISFQKEKFNNIDALILTAIVYLPLPRVPKPGFRKKDRLLALLNEFIDHPTAYKKCVMPNTDLKFARTVKDSKRFNSLELYHYFEDIDEYRQTQFKALTFINQERSGIFVAYCGTDTTLVGWKEDFDLAYQKETRAQNSAVEYLEKIAKDFPNMKILVGGHSKGGNLAMHAASFCHTDIQNRIVNVYNFDGPGFLPFSIHASGYQKIKNRITTYIPPYSIVGILFEHQEKFKIVKANGGLLLQHSFYYWQVDGTDFVYTNQISKISIRVNIAIRDALMHLSENEIKLFCGNVYELFTASGMKTTHEVFRDLWRSFSYASSRFNQMSTAQQDNLTKIFKRLFFSFFRPLNAQEIQHKNDLLKKIKSGK